MRLEIRYVSGELPRAGGFGSQTPATFLVIAAQ